MSKQLDEIRNTCQYCVTTTSVTRSLRNWVRNQAFQSLRSGSRVRVQHVLLVNWEVLTCLIETKYGRRG